MFDWYVDWSKENFQVNLPSDAIAKAIEPLDDASLWTTDGDSIYHMIQVEIVFDR